MARFAFGNKAGDAEITQGLRGPSGEAEGAQIPRDTTNEICNIIARISDLLQQAPLQHY